MAALTLNQLNNYCRAFGYFAEINGDKMEANIFYNGKNFNRLHIETVRLI